MNSNDRKEACERLNVSLRKASRAFHALGEALRTPPLKRKKI